MAHKLAVLLALPSLLTTPAIGWGHQAESTTPPAVTTIFHKPFGGAFSLVDQSGRSVSDRDFRGTPMLIYFGYTNCPDKCPLDAQVISAVIDRLDHRGITVAPIFITTDPMRDTSARLKQFLSAFHPRFVGLTGSADTIGKLAAAYGAGGDRINETTPDTYDVLHPSFAYLMGRKGEFLRTIHLEDEPDAIAEMIVHSVGGAG